MVSKEELIEAMESSLAIIPELPGRLWHLHLPGIPVQGRVTQIPHAFANNVCCATLSDTQADEAIETIKSHFFERDLPFGWTIGPLTMPKNLSERLAAAGLLRGIEMAGMALTDIRAPFFHDTDVRVIEVFPGDTENIRLMTHIAATGFEIPENVAALFTESYLQKHETPIRGYLAFAPDAETPGAFGATIYLPNSKIVLLSGAATVPEQRGRGLYQALVARRLADATADGREAAIIQAVRNTSAPILEKRGFVEWCGFEVWAAFPPGMR